jgi:hypothetical protein
MKKRAAPLIIPAAKEKEIIDYYFTHKDNRVSVISEHFGISISHINSVIDRYFRDKHPVKY